MNNMINQDTAPPAIKLTMFNFEHGAFRAPGAKFMLWGSRRVPTFRVAVGDNDGLIEIDTLCREFNISPESHDGQLIKLAVDGLRFVPDIKPGDSIPSELLTGQASWSINEKHKKIAQERLQVQLLSWVSGKEVLITDPDEIAMFLEQIENREKLRKAFRDAAVALGYPPENTTPVINQLELLARELCYIEALRERLSLVTRVVDWLAAMVKNAGSDQMAKMELQRIQQLVGMGIKEFTQILNEADAQTGEIVAALKSVDRQVAFIRKNRDDLYGHLQMWEPHIKGIVQCPPRRSRESQQVVSQLYRFLAPRFSVGRSILRRPAVGAAAPASDDNRAARINS